MTRYKARFTKNNLKQHLAELNANMAESGVTGVTLIYGHRAGYHAVDFRRSQDGMNTIAYNLPIVQLMDKATIFAEREKLAALRKQLAAALADCEYLRKVAADANERAEAYGKTTDHLIAVVKGM